MKLVYTGPHDAVELTALPGVIAERGKPIEIPDEITVVVNQDDKGKDVTQRLAASLLEQGVWEKAGKSKEADA